MPLSTAFFALFLFANLIQLYAGNSFYFYSSSRLLVFSAKLILYNSQGNIQDRQFIDIAAAECGNTGGDNNLPLTRIENARIFGGQRRPGRGTGAEGDTGQQEGILCEEPVMLCGLQ